ncbi:MAG: CPBP family intramembrane metalloprotease [Chloroflexi bacterium]|nr:CPBP family intramembrane metalloprotease [Chloroflexota bacterium]
MTEAGTQRQFDETPPGMWPPTLWNWKNAVIILVVWFAGFIAVNVIAAMVLLVQSGVMAEIVAGNAEILETVEPVVTFEVQVVSFIGLAVISLGTVAAVNVLGPRNSLQAFGFRPMEQRWWLISAGLAVALAGSRVLLGWGLLLLFPALQESAEALAASLLIPDLTLIESLVMMFFISFWVPFYEEVFFRGFLHNWLRNRLSLWPAIVVSSLAFGFIHIVPVQIVTAFLLGVGLAWVYEKSGSLWSAVVLHVVNNGLLAVLAFAPVLLG